MRLSKARARVRRSDSVMGCTFSDGVDGIDNIHNGLALPKE